MMGAMQTLYLVGPTAVGKTAVALELASRLGAEIVSADSMQVYRGLDIGTAKPTPAELARVHHHLVDVCESSELFDVKRFVALAQAAIADIHQRGRVALVVGGTGLYVRALRQGLFEGPGRDPELRRRLEAMSAPELAAELERVDPATAARIDRQNPRRLVRALEVYYSTGQSIRQLQQQWTDNQARRQLAPLVGLSRDRADLVRRIEQRIDQQLADGWLVEVQRLLEHHGAGCPTALQATGYRELAAHLRGGVPLAETVALVKLRTRQLAKRQMTWFRREAGLTWRRIPPAEPPLVTATFLEQLWQEQANTL
jgi:tRNA dimethylallyltransferase